MMSFNDWVIEFNEIEEDVLGNIALEERIREEFKCSITMRYLNLSVHF